MNSDDDLVSIDYGDCDDASHANGGMWWRQHDYCYGYGGYPHTYKNKETLFDMNVDEALEMLDRKHKDEIRSIRRSKRRKVVPTDDCPICLDDFQSPSNIVFCIKCGNNFHKECVACLNDDRCPLCRNLTTFQE